MSSIIRGEGGCGDRRQQITELGHEARDDYPPGPGATRDERVKDKDECEEDDARWPMNSAAPHATAHNAVRMLTAGQSTGRKGIRAPSVARAIG